MSCTESCISATILLPPLPFPLPRPIPPPLAPLAPPLPLLPPPLPLEPSMDATLKWLALESTPSAMFNFKLASPIFPPSDLITFCCFCPFCFWRLFFPSVGPPMCSPPMRPLIGSGFSPLRSFKFSFDRNVRRENPCWSAVSRFPLGRRVLQMINSSALFAANPNIFNNLVL